jgi:hypothetical protein
MKQLSSYSQVFWSIFQEASLSTFAIQWKGHLRSMSTAIRFRRRRRNWNNE